MKNALTLAPNNSFTIHALDSRNTHTANLKGSFFIRIWREGWDGRVFPNWVWLTKFAPNLLTAGTGIRKKKNYGPRGLIIVYSIEFTVGYAAGQLKPGLYISHTQLRDAIFLAFAGGNNSIVVRWNAYHPESKLLVESRKAAPNEWLFFGYSRANEVTTRKKEPGLIKAAGPIKKTTKRLPVQGPIIKTNRLLKKKRVRQVLKRTARRKLLDKKLTLQPATRKLVPKKWYRQLRKVLFNRQADIITIRKRNPPRQIYYKAFFKYRSKRILFRARGGKRRLDRKHRSLQKIVRTARARNFLTFFRKSETASWLLLRRRFNIRLIWARIVYRLHKKLWWSLRRKRHARLEMKWDTQSYQRRIFGMYRRLTREALGDFRDINKHRFFMKYFRIFFTQMSGYKELELRSQWLKLTAKGGTGGGDVACSIRRFSEAIRLRLDSLGVFLGFAPNLITAREFVQFGCLWVNGIQSFAPFYSICPGDIFQIIPALLRNEAWLKYIWIDGWFRKIKTRLFMLGFMQVEWVLLMGHVYRWPRSYELPAETQPTLSERWLRFYIRFLIPVKVGKWRATKMWWQVYKNNEKIFKRGGPSKYPGAGRQAREQALFNK
jgi:ribosomal protein S4